MLLVPTLPLCLVVLTIRVVFGPPKSMPLEKSRLSRQAPQVLRLSPSRSIERRSIWFVGRSKWSLSDQSAFQKSGFIILKSDCWVNSIGGTIERFAIDPETRALSEKPVQKFAFNGSSVDALRQFKSFIHDVQYSPDGTHLMAVDLGTDDIRRFKVEADGSLTEKGTVKTPPRCQSKF